VLHRNGVVVSPQALVDEIGELEKAGVDVLQRLRISEACCLILPHHIAIDQARERAKGEAKIGTTGRGVGPAYEDKVARRAIRMQDLYARERFAAKLGEVLDYHNFMLKNYYQSETVDFQKTLDETLVLAEAHQADGDRRLSRSECADPRRQEHFVRGCAGGAPRRSITAPTRMSPPRTASRARRRRARRGPGQLHYILGVAKAYATRVGAGRFRRSSTTRSASTCA
jgi:adenylosuccinate synthase